MSGSVSRGKNDPTESLQMIERPLMTPDELKSMPKGQFVVMKTGFHPMKVKLKLFFDWGIYFDNNTPYSVTENANRKVQYAERKELVDAVVKKFHPEYLDDSTGGTLGVVGYVQTESQTHEPQVLPRVPPERRKASSVRVQPPTQKQVPSSGEEGGSDES